MFLLKENITRVSCVVTLRSRLKNVSNILDTLYQLFNFAPSLIFYDLSLSLKDTRVTNVREMYLVEVSVGFGHERARTWVVRVRTDTLRGVTRDFLVVLETSNLSSVHKNSSGVSET